MKPSVTFLLTDGFEIRENLCHQVAFYDLFICIVRCLHNFISSLIHALWYFQCIFHLQNPFANYFDLLVIPAHQKTSLLRRATLAG